jgi:hypothetical protein
MSALGLLQDVTALDGMVCGPNPQLFTGGWVSRMAHRYNTSLKQYGMVWCPSYPLDRNRCDQVVAAGSGAS